jgi:hypothetical protein
LSKENRTFKEVSKIGWKRADGIAGHDDDAIKIGCLQRIAESLESISSLMYQHQRNVESEKRSKARKLRLRRKRK